MTIHELLVLITGGGGRVGDGEINKQIFCAFLYGNHSIWVYRCIILERCVVYTFKQCTAYCYCIHGVQKLFFFYSNVTFVQCILYIVYMVKLNATDYKKKKKKQTIAMSFEIEVYR